LNEALPLQFPTDSCTRPPVTLRCRRRPRSLIAVSSPDVDAARRSSLLPT